MMRVSVAILWVVRCQQLSCCVAVKVCGWCVGDPVVLCGAGCADVAIAHYLRTKVSQLAELLTQSGACD